jgi:hypothetical protein
VPATEFVECREMVTGQWHVLFDIS